MATPEPTAIPDDPVERIRVVRVLREAWRRGQKPCLEATVRHVNDRAYGPYFVARFRPCKRKKRGRTVYLGVPDKESVVTLEVLLELSKPEFLALATKIMRNLHSLLRQALHEVRSLPLKKAKALLVRYIADSMLLEGDSLRDPIPDYPGKLRGFLARVLGRWSAGYSGTLGRILKNL